ncbi:MAG: hypothetical protein ACK4VI_00905 [Alphaproteobacteria bacterium]
MAMYKEDPPITDSIRIGCFNRLKAEGHSFMVEADQFLEDKYCITSSSILRGVRIDRVQQDLTSIYSEVGKIGIKRVYDLKGDFHTARVGGLELLPIQDVIAVERALERDRALGDYKRRLAEIPLLDRVLGRFPD